MASPSFFLAHPEQGPAEPDAAADMDVDWIGVALGWLSGQMTYDHEAFRLCPC